MVMTTSTVGFKKHWFMSGLTIATNHDSYALSPRSTETEITHESNSHFMSVSAF